MSEEQKRLIDVPAEILAANVVSSMIKARGVINLWDAMILRLIVDMRKEAADDLALATSARTTREAVATRNFAAAMFDAGFRAGADWSGEEYILFDIGGYRYNAERDAVIAAAIHGEEKK